MKKILTLIVVTVFSVLLQVYVTPKFAAASVLKNTFKAGPRIINGTLATTNNTTHQASLRRRYSDEFSFGAGHICGGSLISPNMVLSAAHCFDNSNPYNPSYYPIEDFIVVLGNLDRFERNNNTLVFDIVKITYGVQPFNQSTFDKDIALLYLNGSVPANHPTVRPIILNRLPVAAGTVCQVTGWGYTETGLLARNLMTLDVPIISFEVCQTETDFEEGLIIDGMMCAGYMEGMRDACGGDSGGPLVCNGLLTGIVSWGDGCALSYLPGVYTDVEYYETWIQEKAAAYGVTLEGSPSYVFL